LVEIGRNSTRRKSTRRDLGKPPLIKKADLFSARFLWARGFLDRMSARDPRAEKKRAEVIIRPRITPTPSEVSEFLRY